jgi:hypothetical protein
MTIKPLLCFSLLCLLGCGPSEGDPFDTDSSSQALCGKGEECEPDEDEAADEERATQLAAYLSRDPAMEQVVKVKPVSTFMFYSMELKTPVVGAEVRKAQRPEMFYLKDGKMEKCTDDQRKKLKEEFIKRWKAHHKGHGHHHGHHKHDKDGKGGKG